MATPIKGFLGKIPFPFWVIGCLFAGFGIGMAFPKSTTVHLMYVSGTYFPHTVVTFAGFLIFNLLGGASAKLVLFHRNTAGRLFGLMLTLYIALALFSLFWVTAWVPYLTGLPMTLPGQTLPGPLDWVVSVGRTFKSVLRQQPLLQVLVAATVFGFLIARIKPLLPIARGMIFMGDKILAIFKSLLWFYPIMIGLLAIGIPVRFGSKGVAAYGKLVVWIALLTVSWMVISVFFCKFTTKRTWKQILTYFGTVYPTGFGTGGSYDTMAVNIISAERDLCLRKEIAEVCIVFGVVLNKNCSGMSIMLTTVTLCNLMKFPISMMEILLLIPPVLIMGLETPGIPNGSAYTMAPVIGVLLGVPNPAEFTAAFIALYAGFITMFTASGQSCDDGLVAMVINDRFDKYLGLPPQEPEPEQAVALAGGR